MVRTCDAAQRLVAIVHGAGGRPRPDRAAMFPSPQGGGFAPLPARMKKPASARGLERSPAMWPKECRAALPGEPGRSLKVF